jgi:dihydroorotase
MDENRVIPKLKMLIERGQDITLVDSALIEDRGDLVVLNLFTTDMVSNTADDADESDGDPIQFCKGRFAMRRADFQVLLDAMKKHAEKLAMGSESEDGTSS